MLYEIKKCFRVKNDKSFTEIENFVKKTRSKKI